MAALETSEAAFYGSLDRAEEVLWENGYPGRWLAIGRGQGQYIDQLMMAYSFGGRSDTSKDRTTVRDGDAIKLVAPGLTQEQMAEISDAALIYYPTSDTLDEAFVVSNGAQTRPVLEAIAGGDIFPSAVSSAPKVHTELNGKPAVIDLSSYEPDAPNFTPRITGFVDLHPDGLRRFGLAVVRKHAYSDKEVRSFYNGGVDDLVPGQGWAIQTYAKNNPEDTETPVPSFGQEPYGFPMDGSTTDIAVRVREAIGEKTFAAVIVRAIDLRRKKFIGSTIIDTRG